MKIKSILEFQEIKDLTPIWNVLIYKEKKIPCVCSWNNGYIKIDCKTYLTEGFLKELIEADRRNDIKINGTKFYICENIVTSGNVGEYEKITFSLINLNKFEVEEIDLMTFQSIN